MSDSGAEAIITATLDPASIELIITKFREMFTEIGVLGTGSMDQFEQAAVRVGKSGSKAIGNLKKPVTELTHDLDKMSNVMTTGLTEMNSQIVHLAKTLRNLGVESNVQAAGVRTSGSAVRQNLIGTRETEAALSRQKLAEIRNEGRVSYVEAQKGEVLAREAAKMRLVITQQLFHQITRIEKAIGATIVGVAKTTVSAFSSAMGGLASVISRVFSRGGTSAREMNKQLTGGLSSSLKERESVMRSSFTRQERIISASAARQEATLTAMRTRTNTGVVGAANRGLNIGALLGGAGILMAAKSTFTIGAEFARGLAVLQAQLGLTADQMAEVRKQSIALGNDITLPGVSALDAAQAIQLLAKQFAVLGPGAIKAAEDASKGTLQLARAANVSAEDAAQVVGAAVNVFHVAASDATAVADQVAAALKNAAGVSFGDFADAFKQGAAVFAQFQVPAVGAKEALVEFDTALAAIARQGVTGSDAGTSLKQFFLQANRGTKDAVKALQQMAKAAGESGTAFYDANGKARPFQETLKILRNGLKGLTDEQRNAQLQQVFGSDAIRVANALLSVSAEDYAKLTEQVREQGLASKIAAAQNTGFKGALDALKSVVETIQIIFYEKINPVLGDFTLAIANAANVIFFSDGAWATLRKGLIGVAIGMGAIIAVKAAVEVLQLLGSALKLLLTPWGALIFVAGLLGGAIAIAMDRSKEFAAAVHVVWGNIKDLAKTVGDFVVKEMAAFSDWFVKTAVPAMVKFGKAVINWVVNAWDIAFKFVRDKLIPAFMRLVNFVLPKVAAAWDWVTEKAKAFWHVVEPFLRPLIDGFHDLANAVGAMFSGFDWGVLKKGFGSALSGIVGTGAKIVDRIWEFLFPLGKRIVAFFKELFSKKHIDQYISGVLDFIELVGKTLALIVTDPMVFKVLAVVAAAAAVIAFRFIKGVIEGIIQNLPDLWDLLRSALVAGFKLAFDNIGVVTLVAGFALGLFKAFKLAEGLFTKAGQQAGGGFLTGFKSSIAAARGFTSTLFSGSGLNKNNSALAKASGEAFGLQNELRIMGGSTEPVLLTKSSINNAKGEVTKLRAGLTNAQYAALKMRDNIRLSGEAIGTIGTGIKNMVTSFPAAGKQFAEAFNLQRALAGAGGKDPFHPITQSAYAAFNGIRDHAKVAFTPVTEGFRSIGKSASGAWTIARVAASETMDKVKRETNTAFGGVVSGWKQLGSMGKSAWVMARVAMSETFDKMKGSKIVQLGATAATGFANTFKAGFKGIGTAFTGMLAGLKDVATKMGTTVGGLIGHAIGKAAIGAAATVGGFVAGRAEGQAGGTGLLSAILGGVSAGAMIGGPWGAAVGVITGGAALIGAAMGRAEKKAKDFRDAVSALAKTFSGQLVDGIKAGEVQLAELNGMDVKSVLNIGDNQKTAVDAIAGSLSDAGIKAIKDAGLNIRTDVIPMIEAAGGSIEKFRTQFVNAFISATGATDDFKNKFGASSGQVQQILKDIAAPGGASGIGSWLGQGNHINSTIGGLISSQKDYLQSLLDTSGAIGKESEEIIAATQKALDLAKITEAATPDPKRGLWGSIVAGVANLGPAAEKAKDAHNAAVEAMKLKVDSYKARVDATYDSLNSLFGVSRSGFQSAKDTAIVAAEGVASTLQEAFAQGGLVGKAKANLALDSLGTDFGAALKAGIQDKTIVDEATAKKNLEPIRQALISSLDPKGPGYDAAVKAINTAYNTALTGVSPTIDVIKAQEAAAGFATEVQSYLDAHPFSTLIEARFSTFMKTEGGKQSAQRNPEVFGTKQSFEKAMTQTQVISQEFEKIGAAIDGGVAKGVVDNGWVVDSAVASMVKHAYTIANTTAQIKSPSKLFGKVGHFMSAGLAEGIRGGAGLIHHAATSAVMGAVDAARQVNGTIDLSVNSRINGLTPAAFVSSQGQQGGGITESDAVRIARALAAEQKPNVNIDQTFHEKVDSRAVAADVAWRLT